VIVGDLYVGKETEIGIVREFQPRPLQIPNADRILSQAVIGGGEIDERAYFDVRTLSELLEVAKLSPIQRALLHPAGVRKTLHRARSGWIYAVWALISPSPVPEQTAIVPGVPMIPRDERWISDRRHPGQDGLDEQIGESVFLWGPGSSQDARFVFHVDAIEARLRVAMAAPSRRCMLANCGIKMALYQKGPRSYVNLWLTHSPPRPV